MNPRTAIVMLPLFVVAALTAGAADLAKAPIRPDPAHTPGAINPLATAAVLCAKGYSTKSVRPPAEYTDKLKAQQLAAYGYASRNKKLYEEDHLISLEIGGHPSDPRNLWPEVWKGTCGAHVKDKLENKLHEVVCAGKITLAEAQGEIASDWVRSYNLHVGALTCP